MTRAIKTCLLVLAAVLFGAEFARYATGSPTFWWFDIKAFLAIAAVSWAIWRLRREFYLRALDPAKARMAQVQLKKEREYEMLPELGKARVDKKDAEYSLTGKTVGWVALTGVSFLIAWPIGVIIGVRGVKGIQSAWREYNADTRAAEDRRYKALSS